LPKAIEGFIEKGEDVASEESTDEITDEAPDEGSGVDEADEI
jgi:hypothetical protein